ncbi:MarC family protein [bacterium]|nr:MarC family protein [bacterium]RQV99527.1 MAG: MarC family protein [bacterium]
MSIFSAAVLLFLVLDPLGNIPIFTSVLKSVDPRQHRKIIIRELLLALVILALFLFFGRHILSLLEVSQSSLGIAGGIVLLMIAIKMVFVGSDMIFENISDEGPFIVPLAVPLIAGPSAMAMVILLMAREPSRWLEWLLALFFAWLASGVLLILSDKLSQILSKRVLKAIERLMGMILTAVAVEMFVDGIRHSVFN